MSSTVETVHADAAPLTPEQSHELVVKASMQHLSILTSKWGEHGSRGRGVVWTDTGLARLAHTVGWLSAQPDRELAGNMAADLFAQLDRLSNYAGEHQETVKTLGRYPTVFRHPNCLVEMSDDGTFGGWSLLCCARLDPEKARTYTGEIRHTHEYLGDRATYAFQFNGGLLFHGFDHSGRGGYPYAVCLNTDHYWSVHT